MLEGFTLDLGFIPFVDLSQIYVPPKSSYNDFIQRIGRLKELGEEVRFISVVTGGGSGLISENQIRETIYYTLHIECLAIEVVGYEQFQPKKYADILNSSEYKKFRDNYFLDNGIPLWEKGNGESLRTAFIGAVALIPVVGIVTSAIFALAEVFNSSQDKKRIDRLKSAFTEFNNLFIEIVTEFSLKNPESKIVKKITTGSSENPIYSFMPTNPKGGTTKSPSDGTVPSPLNVPQSNNILFVAVLMLLVVVVALISRK